MLEKTMIVEEHPHVELAKLLKAVRLDPESAPEEAVEIEKMLEGALAVARPKAIYGLAQVESRDENGVTVDGVRFRSALVSRNLAKTSRIVPHVSTCGVEAEEWSLQYKDDPLYEFWADAIKLQLLGVIGTKLREEVRRRYFPEGDMSAMGPGSLAAWPLTEQRPLFALLGGVTPDIGARLTDSCLILPSKSNSGFFFSAESHYENCRYCPLIKCPNRRAPFEHELEGAPKDE